MAIDAISSLFTKDFKDTIDSNSFLTLFEVVLVRSALALITLFILSPSTDPGQIALTRILFLPNYIARVLVKPITPHLLTA